MKILAMGLSCPLGLRWANACAAVRAGLVPFTELEYVDDDGEPILGAALEQLDALAGHQDRWIRLLAWALAEALAELPFELRSRLPVVLALPATARGRAHEPSWVHGSLEQSTAEALGLRPEMFAIVPGHESSAGVTGLAWARSYLADHEYCLVGAADSLIGAGPLAKLAQQRRLLTDTNPDGVIPGEGAACVLLGRRSGSVLAHVRGLGFGQEPGLRTNAVPLRATGVIAAARAALAEAGCTMDHIDLRISDAAGESYEFREQALLLPRLLQAPKPELPLMLPATSLGHVGVAGGICGLVLATEALACELAPGPRIMCFAGSTGPDRAALVVEAARAGSN
jgi:3-oxoacyl-[acyl-carrier-protein] synthase-1